MTQSGPIDRLPCSSALFHIDEHWRIIAVNESAQELTGRSAEELLGRQAEDILCGSREFSSLAKLCQPVHRGHIVTNHPILICSGPDKTPKSLLATIIPFPGTDGSFGGVVISLQDTAAADELNLVTLNAVADGIFTVDMDANITLFNRAAEQLTGWSSEEVLGTPCNRIFHARTDSDECTLHRTIREGITLVNKPIFVTRKDGSTLPISISTAPMLSPEGEIYGGMQTFRDNTEGLLNRLIISSVADGVFTVDRDWRITSFNQAAERITGWSSQEVIGKRCREVFHSSVCGKECLLQSSVEEETDHIDKTIFMRHRDGHYIPVSISSSPLLDDRGNVIGGIETFRDNTMSLRKSLILDSIADGVFTVDRNWQITSFNRAAEEITGWTRAEALGKSCSEVFHSSICGRNCAIAESLYSGRPVANRSITIRNKRGESIPISISASPLADHEGNIVGGVETFRDLTAITSLRRELTRKYTFDAIISKSVAMQRLFHIMPEIARSPSTVLITGESGTGKELVARALYNHSERQDKPFVVVNCGALPETLLESELFGYKAGAFTDARKDKKGRFAAAEGGTLFLDEIGEIPPTVQVKLLRVLQEKVYEPLGSNTPVKADVRIITATNRNLEEMVREGRFREDLFYRLNVVKINLPPLRERKEDIPLLVDHFIKKTSAQQGKDIVGISAAAMNILMRHDYPGNIRELENIIEYAFILCGGGYIQPEHLPEPFAPGFSDRPDRENTKSGPQTLEEVERQAIELALERNRWKKMATCRELGISKDTLRRKIKKYGLKNPAAI